MENQNQYKHSARVPAENHKRRLYFILVFNVYLDIS